MEFSLFRSTSILSI